jgi:hypothetical protein
MVSTPRAFYAFGPDNLALHPIEQRVVRLSREDLIAITNCYFDGITAHDGSMIMAQATRRPEPVHPALAPRSREFQSAKRSRQTFSVVDSEA